MRNRSNSIALLAILMALASTARADALTDQGKILLAQEKAGAAYELLIAEEAARAGNPEFDLLLGIAAVESGHNTNAIFALSRVLAVEPNNARARAEIARAYLAVGETQTARREFETVRDQPVPDDVKATIDRVLSAIERIDEQGRTVVHGFAEFTYGHDTNVNAGPAGSQVAVPAFGGLVFTLANSSVALRDDYTNYAAGVSLRTPLAAGLDLTASVTANKRINGSYDVYDTGSADGNVGVVYSQGKDIYSLGYQDGTFYVDNTRYRDSNGFTGQWQHNYDARTQGSVFIQYGWLRYPFQRARNAERTVAGFNLGHLLRDEKTLVYGGLYTGDERDTESGFDFLGHRLWGARGGVRYQFQSNASVFANLTYESDRYRGKDPFFLADRHDDLTDFSVGVAWNFADKWRLTPQYTYTHNNSNIPINDYKREMISVSVRRDF
jgi:tetratricopeptide (TPR) repeat protein